MATAQTEARVLADRLIAGNTRLADVARIVAGNVLMVLCAQLVLPLPWTPVPITGQTFGVLLVAVLLGARRSAIVMGLYLLEGLAGLPVFSPLGLPGAARFLGPTAGYLIAYPAAAFVAGWLVERRPAVSRGKAAVISLLEALVAGELIIFAAGCAWLAWAMQMGWRKATLAGAAPFMPGELLKVALVLAAARGIEIAGRKN
jgi:biotin transport system substrate-specific component